MVQFTTLQTFSLAAGIAVLTVLVTMLGYYMLRRQLAKEDAARNPVPDLDPDGFNDAIHQARIETMAQLGGRIGVLEGQMLQFKTMLDGMSTVTTRMHQLEMQLPSMLELQEKYVHAMDKLHKRVATRQTRENEAEKTAATSEQTDFMAALDAQPQAEEPTAPSNSGVVGNGGPRGATSISQFERPGSRN